MKTRRAGVNKGGLNIFDLRRIFPITIYQVPINDIVSHVLRISS